MGFEIQLFTPRTPTQKVQMVTDAPEGKNALRARGVNFLDLKLIQYMSLLESVQICKSCSKTKGFF